MSLVQLIEERDRIAAGQSRLRKLLLEVNIKRALNAIALTRAVHGKTPADPADDLRRMREYREMAPS